MRTAAGTAVLTVVLSLLAACGSSSSEPPVLNGGLNGSAPAGTGSFLITPSDGGALAIPAAYCSGIGASLAGLVVAFSDYTPFCTFKRQANACGDHPNSKEVILILARAGLTAPPAFGPGTYTIGTTSGASYTTVASVDFRTLEAACAEPTTYQSVTGTITIDQVSPSVKGSVNATFWSGATGTGTNLGAFAGGFDVGGCTLPLDLCGLISGGTCTVPACIP